MSRQGTLHFLCFVMWRVTFYLLERLQVEGRGQLKSVLSLYRIGSRHPDECPLAWGQVLSNPMGFFVCSFVSLRQGLTLAQAVWELRVSCLSLSSTETTSDGATMSGRSRL